MSQGVKDLKSGFVKVIIIFYSVQEDVPTPGMDLGSPRQDKLGYKTGVVSWISCDLKGFECWYPDTTISQALLVVLRTINS